MTYIRIAPATRDDVPLILAFIRKLAEYEKLSHEVTATEESLAESLFGERPAAEALLAYAGEESAGFVVFFYSFSTVLGRPGLYLEDLFVEPRFRGLGIGKLLLEYLARVAVERGCGRMEWSVLNWNETAIRFYRGLGAEPKDEWTVYRLTGESLKRLAGTDEF
jgi:GNAT superfamily N-acetyltransferase